MGDVGYVHQLLQRKLRSLAPKDFAGRMVATRHFIEAAGASLRLHRASPMRIIGIPALQIPLFVTFVMATRGLIDQGGNGLDSGGVAWFIDLTARDETLVLPLLAVGATYLNLELSLGQLPAQPQPSPGDIAPTLHPTTDSENTTSEATASLFPAAAAAKSLEGSTPATTKAPALVSSSVAGVVKDLLQTALIVGLPVVATLPSGAFMYWIASSAFSTAQTVLLRQPAVRTSLGLPVKK
jgi:YidC/Oxa1 family membrane protein insertase